MAKKESKPRQRQSDPVKRDRTLKNIPLADITFKKPELLVNFMSSRFKILPSKKTGVSTKKQRKLQNEIKKARFLALLPFTDRHSIR